MGHAGASRKSPEETPRETKRQRLSRPISAPPLTAALSWRNEKKNGETDGHIQLRSCTLTVGTIDLFWNSCLKFLAHSNH